MKSKVIIRTAIIMLVIIAFESWGYVAMLGHAAPSRVFGLMAFRSSAAVGWFLGALVAALYVWGAAKSLPIIGENLFRLIPLKLLALVFALLSGLVEELLFRRMLMNGLQDAHYAWPAQLVASAISFGLLHALFGAFSGSWRAFVSPMLWTGALGVALAATYLIDGRDVAPCIWSHVLINLFIEPWLLMDALRRSAVRRAPA